MSDATPLPTPPAAPDKVWWKSKTILLNVVALVALMVPQVQAWLKANPEEPMAVLVALNVIVRFVTSGRVTLFDESDSAGGTGVLSGRGNSGDSNSASRTGVGPGSHKRMELEKQRTRSLPWLVVSGCAALLFCLLCSGCGSLAITEDGCILGSYQRDGMTYQAGACVDADGKVDRVRVQWRNGEGQEIRATIYRKSNGTLIEYRLAGSMWIRWTAKSGVQLGPLPTEVETALENEVPLPAKAGVISAK